jgi:CRP-like cAMP-binding protein
MIDPISNVPLFHGLQHRHIANIRRLGCLLDLTRGTVLCTRGRPPGQFAVVIAGEFYVRRDHRTFVCGPGSHFGALELLGKQPCDATVWTESAARALIFEPRAFAGMLFEVPILTRRLMSDLVKHVPMDSSLFCLDTTAAKDAATAVLAASAGAR